MPRVIEEEVTVSVSKLVRKDAGDESILTDENYAVIEATLQEILGDSVVVEVQVED